MARATLKRWVRRLALSGAIVLGLLWVLNLPYYSGAGGPQWRWRMEHGRLKIEHRSEPISPETFYIAPNSEGLRFNPEFDFHGGDWSVVVPLWIPFVACLVVAVRGRRAGPEKPRRSDQRHTRCW